MPVDGYIGCSLLQIRPRNDVRTYKEEANLSYSIGQHRSQVLSNIRNEITPSAPKLTKNPGRSLGKFDRGCASCALKAPEGLDTRSLLRSQWPFGSRNLLRSYFLQEGFNLIIQDSGLVSQPVGSGQDVLSSLTRLCGRPGNRLYIFCNICCTPGYDRCSNGQSRKSDGELAGNLNVVHLGPLGSVLIFTS